jgi:hypothetical protein
MAGAQQLLAVTLTAAAAVANLCQAGALRASYGQAGHAHTSAGPCAGWSRLPQHGASVCIVVRPSQPAGSRPPGGHGCRRRLPQPGGGPMISPYRGRAEVRDAQAAEFAVTFPDRALGQALQQGIQGPASGAAVMPAGRAAAEARRVAAQPVPGRLHDVAVDRSEPARGPGLAHEPPRVARAHAQRRAQPGDGDGVRVCLKREPGQVTITGLVGVTAHGTTRSGQQVRRGVQREHRRAARDRGGTRHASGPRSGQGGGHRDDGDRGDEQLIEDTCILAVQHRRHPPTCVKRYTW